MKNLLKKGFTLIELLIVIAIIGILTAMVVTNLSGVRQRARDTRRKSDLRAIEQSLRLYYNDAKRFPSGSTPNFQITGCGTIAAPTVCNWGSAFATSTTTYMGSLPQDPSSGGAAINYQYESTSDDKYIIVAKLENLSDLDIADTQSRCTTAYASFTGTKSVTTDYVVCAQ